MARAGNSEAIATGSYTVAFSGRCHEIFVENKHASVGLRVQVLTQAGDGGIHGTDEYFTLAAGKSMSFAAAPGDQINTLNLEGDSAESTASWTVTAG